MFILDINQTVNLDFMEWNYMSALKERVVDLLSLCVCLSVHNIFLSQFSQQLLIIHALFILLCKMIEFYFSMNLTSTSCKSEPLYVTNFKMRAYIHIRSRVLLNMSIWSHNCVSLFCIKVHPAFFFISTVKTIIKIAKKAKIYTLLYVCFL